MSRYILDINSDIAKCIVIFGMVGERGISTVFKINELKELTTDYIKEHFSNLQDMAYRKGRESVFHELEISKSETHKTTEIIDLRESKNNRMPDKEFCNGCRYENNTGEHLPCDYCCNNFGCQWEADDKIEVRDEVVWTEDENVVIVVTRVYTANNMEWCDGVCRDGKVYHILTENARKTGRRFDIDKILEEMKV